MDPTSLPALRELLIEGGYGVLFRTNVWSECLVHRGADRWLGAGLTEEDAFHDAIGKVFPSHLVPLLVARRASPTYAPSAIDVAPTPEVMAEANEASIGGAARLPAGAQEEASIPAPDDETTRAEAPAAQIASAPAAPAIEAAAPLAAIAEPVAAHLEPVLSAAPANEVPQLERPARPPRPRASDVLETVERVLAEIEERLGSLARMCADRQRLNMLVWICRARAVEESLPGAREVEHAVARVARRLTEIGKMFWPGSVRALQLSARPSDVRREMHATWAPEPANWADACKLAEKLLDDHLARSADAALDDEGWADGPARTPRPADPEALFEEVDAEIKAMIGPLGDAQNGRSGELGPIEFEALINAARKLRWLRGAVRDDLAWGMAMGRLRRAIPNLGERAGRVRDALDHRAKPPSSWAKVLGERDAEPSPTPTETSADLAAALPQARESKEGLMAWLIRAFDVLNTPELVQLVGPIRADLAAFEEDALNHADRRVRRRLRELLRRVAPSSGDVESSPRPKDPEREDEDVASDEPFAGHALDQLSARVRATTTGKRALFVSNRDDPELGAKLTDLLGITITWCDGSLRRVQAACERIARGSYDLILSATGFQVHGVDTALARAAGAADVPYVRVNRGRPVACVQAIAREFGLNVDERKAM